MLMNTSEKSSDGNQPTYKIYPGTVIGENFVIGDFSVLGVPPSEPTTPLSIGKHANIRSHTIIYAGNSIGNYFTTGHGAFIQQNNELGNSISLGTKSIILRNCHIEDNVRIHSQVFIAEYTIIEKQVWIGPNVVLTNTKHPTCKYAKECMKQDSTKIGTTSIIGANSTILPGVTIGFGALIGAGSVVTKNVPEDTVVVGNPARKIGNTSDLECYKGLIEHPYNEIKRIKFQNQVE